MPANVSEVFHKTQAMLEERFYQTFSNFIPQNQLDPAWTPQIRSNYTAQKHLVPSQPIRERVFSVCPDGHTHPKSDDPNNPTPESCSYPATSYPQLNRMGKKPTDADLPRCGKPVGDAASPPLNFIVPSIRDQLVAIFTKLNKLEYFKSYLDVMDKTATRNADKVFCTVYDGSAFSDLHEVDVTRNQKDCDDELKIYLIRGTDWGDLYKSSTYNLGIDVFLILNLPRPTRVLYPYVNQNTHI